MPLKESEKPADGSPPPIGLLIVLVAASAVITAALIVLYLESVPLPIRVLLAAAELLITSLACWAILKANRR